MRLVLFMLLGSVLVACNLDNASLPTPNADNKIIITATPLLPTPDADGVIYVTATPQVTPNGSSDLSTNAGIASVPSLTPTFAPTLTPTPFVQPYEALAKANQQGLYGYYEQAFQQYADILAQGDALAPEIRAEATFRLGQSALKESRFAEARDALTSLITLFPAERRTPQAYFLRGDAYLGLSEWQNAINDFQQFLALRPGLVDSYAYERIGDAQLALGQVDTALASYLASINANRTLVQQLALREKVAQVLLNYGRITEAIAQYDAILAVAQNAPYRASIELLATQALFRTSDTQNAIARARTVFENYTNTPSAYSAMKLLEQNGITLNDWMRGRVSFNYGDYVGAINAFNAYTSSVTLDAIPAELYLLLGRAYREIGNPSAAIIAFQTIIEQYKADPLFGDALLEQGRTRFLSGDIPSAISTYLAVAQTYSSLEATASEAMWRAGYLYGTNGDPVKSRETFVELARLYPNSTWATNGLLLAASAAVSNQEWAMAENLYGRISAISTGENRAAAYLWVGRLARERGDQRTSEEALNLARLTAPDSFFAARAADLLNGIEPFTPPNQPRYIFDEEVDRTEADTWVKQTFGLVPETDLRQFNATLQADSRLTRANELWELAATDEAIEEFRGILDDARAQKDGVTAYQMAIYLREKGAFLSSIVAAADVITASGTSTLEAPRYIARMRFPIYYSELVLEQASQYGFDPLVLFALIRQESLYNPLAVSSAGASGLTQVMPATGQYIAGKIGYSGFTTSDLFRPYVAVAMGAYYIQEQLRLFNGNTGAALAAYNAGPGRALDWYKLSGGNIDAFILTIQFEETRRYVERIYSHYAIYRVLYSD